MVSSFRYQQLEPSTPNFIPFNMFSYLLKWRRMRLKRASSSDINVMLGKDVTSLLGEVIK